jgi:putative ABC transport system ATP-binding protein
MSITSTLRPGDLRGVELTKTYGNVYALDHVSLTVPSGQSLAITGPSGSGKSTLLHCLAGIAVPEWGEASLGDVPITALPDSSRSTLRRHHFGFVFQDGQLIPELPARENVALPLMLNGMRREQALVQADDMLGRLGLQGAVGRRPGEMSGGQAQRIAIARALVHSPSVVFADEPTGALDQATGREVMQVLSSATHSFGATLVVVTHDPQVAQWCSRTIELFDGRLHADRLVA